MIVRSPFIETNQPGAWSQGLAEGSCISSFILFYFTKQATFVTMFLLWTSQSSQPEIRSCRYLQPTPQPRNYPARANWQLCQPLIRRKASALCSLHFTNQSGEMFNNRDAIWTLQDAMLVRDEIPAICSPLYCTGNRQVLWWTIFNCFIAEISISIYFSISDLFIFQF